MGLLSDVMLTVANYIKQMRYAQGKFDKKLLQVRRPEVVHIGLLRIDLT